MFKQFVRDPRGDFAQFAFVAPILVLVSVGLVNLALFGIAGVNASNAANYGARVGSVSQRQQTQRAKIAALSKLDAISIGEYSVSVLGGQVRGSQISVRVTYSVDNYFASIGSLFGADMSPKLSKTTVAYFRQEGW
jgi:Flp pilus assembly protein TadG